MADKKIKLSIEGQDIVCNFGVFYFYKHYKDATGIDPLLNGFGQVEGLGLIDTLVNIFYSGYKAEQSSKKSRSRFIKRRF